MLGEIVFSAPAIFETKTICLPVWAGLAGEKGIERDQQVFVR